LAGKTLADLGKKTGLPDSDKKKFLPMSAWKDHRSRFKKEESSDDADRTFPNTHQPNIIQG